MRTRDKGYIYFQTFIPGNDSDIRLVVVGNHCFGIRRYSRKGDFRSSGSGIKDFNPSVISKNAVKSAFEMTKKLEMQSVAFDFLFHNEEYKLIEISYAFVSYKFPGYWDKELNWHEGEISPQHIMIEDFIKSIENNTQKLIKV